MNKKNTAFAKIIAEKGTIYSLHLKCSQCENNQVFWLGNSIRNKIKNREEAQKELPTHRFNGWNISDFENIICPVCQLKYKRQIIRIFYVLVKAPTALM